MRVIYSMIALGLCLTGVHRCAAQDASTKEADSTAKPKVLALVGSQAITQADLDFQLGRTQQANLPVLAKNVERTTVHLIALQRQALQTLRVQKVAADRDEVLRWIEANQNSEGQSATANQLVDATTGTFGIDREAYLDLIAFRLSWKRYLAEQLNDENLTRHFQNQKSRFDGSTFTIALISVPVPAGDSEERKLAASQLQKLRTDSSDDGDSSWAMTEEEAKLRHWEVQLERSVRGSGSVESSVIDALLKLPEGKTSPPLHTAAGVHLVRLKSKKPGKLELDEVKDEVRAHMLVFLLEYLASQSQEQLPLRAIEH